jgi:integral membrane sensor domain MASE1
MSIYNGHSHADDACPKPFSPMGLVIIGVLVLVSIILWQHGPSVGTLVLLPLMLICPLTHFFTHRHRN